MGKLSILEMVLFDEPSNKRRATREVVDIFRWWVSTNLEFTKQWVDLELTRAQNGILLRWSWPRIKGEVRETKSEWGSEKADALSQIKLVAAQGSSMWPSVCVESWGSLSIFPRVSRSLKVDLIFISLFHFIFIFIFIFDLFSIFRTRVSVKWQDHAVTQQVTSDDTVTSHMIHRKT